MLKIYYHVNTRVHLSSCMLCWMITAKQQVYIPAYICIWTAFSVVLRILCMIFTHKDFTCFCRKNIKL